MVVFSSRHSQGCFCDLLPVTAERRGTWGLSTLANVHCLLYPMWPSFPSSLKLHSTSLLRDCSHCGFLAFPCFTGPQTPALLLDNIPAGQGFSSSLFQALWRPWRVPPAENVLGHLWWCCQAEGCGARQGLGTGRWQLGEGARRYSNPCTRLRRSSARLGELDVHK